MHVACQKSVANGLRPSDQLSGMSGDFGPIFDPKIEIASILKDSFNSKVQIFAFTEFWHPTR